MKGSNGLLIGQAEEKIGNVVVELSVLNGSDDKRLEAEQERWQDEPEPAAMDGASIEHASRANSADWLNDAAGERQHNYNNNYENRRHHRNQYQYRNNNQLPLVPTPPPTQPPLPAPSPAHNGPPLTTGPSNSACDLKQRLLPAHQRDEICFWFKLDENLPNLISHIGDDDGGAGGQLVTGSPSLSSSQAPPRSSASAPGASQSARERLVEAELHVFKLFPPVLYGGGGASANQRDNFEPLGSLDETNSQPLDGHRVKVS